MIGWIIESWQPADIGQTPAAEDVPAEGRSRTVEVLHGAVVDPRVTITPLDGGRSTGTDPFAGGEQASGHHVPLLTALVGQSAAGDAVSIVGSSTVSDMARTPVPAPGKDGEVAEKLSERTTVGYLVAFDEMAAALGYGAFQLTTGPSRLAEVASHSLLDEILTPQFTCDVAALTVAIDEIASQAEEMGVGLLGILAEPIASGEAALVAGLLGAGLAYRHWRGGSGQTPSEEQELLAARFLHGPASLRLAKRAGA